MVLCSSKVHCELLVTIVMATLSFLLEGLSSPTPPPPPPPPCEDLRPETSQRWAALEPLTAVDSSNAQASPSKPRWSQQEMNPSATDTYLDKIINVLWWRSGSVSRSID